MKIILAIILISAITCPLAAQVTMGSGNKPLKGALLDLKEFEPDSDNKTSTKGFALPRVELVDRYSLDPITSDNTSKSSYTGMTVYNLSDIPVSNGKGGVKEGLNIWNGNEWILLGGNSSPAFFYMPPFYLELGIIGETKTIDLYNEFVKRFPQNQTSPTSDNPLFVCSSDVLPARYERGDLYYIVIDYSDEITITGIDANENMTYTTNSTTISDNSYINLILVVK